MRHFLGKCASPPLNCSVCEWKLPSRGINDTAPIKPRECQPISRQTHTRIHAELNARMHCYYELKIKFLSG